LYPQSRKTQQLPPYFGGTDATTGVEAASSRPGDIFVVISTVDFGKGNGEGPNPPPRAAWWCVAGDNGCALLGRLSEIALTQNRLHQIAEALNARGILSKASTWPLLAAMNRSRYSHGKARKGALIFVRQRLMRANLDRLSVIRDGPI
jgi:hypothetical protein